MVKKVAQVVVRGLAVGLNKGHIFTKVATKKDLVRPARRKGSLGKRVSLIREIIREVTGLAPYEKRIVELLKVGGAKESKKALKMAKRRLGTHRRALKKRELLEEYVRA